MPFSHLYQALLLAMLAFACGSAAPAPVLPPPDFSPDAQIMALLERKLAQVEKDPSDARAHHSLGLVYGSNAAWALASQCFRNALELDPDDVHASHELARSLGQEGDLDGRLEWLNRLATRNPEFLAGRQDLGVELLERDRLAEAQVEFQALEDQQDGQPLGPLGLGEVAMARGQANEAIKQFKLALKRAPNEKYVSFKLGQAYLDLGDEKRAKPLLELGAGTNRPMFRTRSSEERKRYEVGRGARLALAVNQFANGDNRAAIRTLETLRSQDPKDTVCLNNLAVGYMRTQQFEKALGVLDSILVLDPEQQGIRMNQASCFMQIGQGQQERGDQDQGRQNLERALAVVGQSLESTPRYGRAHILCGRILSALGRRGDAVQAARSGIDNGEITEEAFLLLARTTEGEHGLAAAAAVLQEGLQKPGARLELRYQLCGLFLKMDRGQEARMCQERMAELGPNDARTAKVHRILVERGF